MCRKDSVLFVSRNAARNCESRNYRTDLARCKNTIKKQLPV